MPITIGQLYDTLHELLYRDEMDPDAEVVLIGGSATAAADLVWTPPQKDRVYIQDDGTGGEW